MPPQEPSFNELTASLSINPNSLSTESLDMMRSDYIQGTLKKSSTTEYTREELLSFYKCFMTDTPAATSCRFMNMFKYIMGIPSALIRYGVLLPLRVVSLTASTVAFFTALPIAVTLKNSSLVGTCVKYYCKGILFSLGVKVNYKGKKPQIQEPHVFVANHTSYLDYILLSAHKYPHAVVMAKHTGVLGFLQNNGLNYLHSMTFDRSNVTERKDLSESLKRHVRDPETWPNPMIIFPEGTCVNNKYTIRFQKGAFELGVKVCPVGIKYNRYFGDPYWDTRKGFMYYAFYKMTRWMSSVDVVYCEPNMPSRGEGAAQFGHRIRQVIASSIGLNCVDFNGMAKRDLLKALQEDEEESKKLR